MLVGASLNTLDQDRNEFGLFELAFRALLGCGAKSNLLSCASSHRQLDRMLATSQRGKGVPSYVRRQKLARA